MRISPRAVVTLVAGAVLTWLLVRVARSPVGAPAPVGAAGCVGEWEPWGPCSATCGAATRFRKRVDVGLVPPCQPRAEVLPCAVPECGCEAGAWSAWTACSTTCGAGVRSRSRLVLPEGRPGCPPCQETEPCRGNRPCRRLPHTEQPGWVPFRGNAPAFSSEPARLGCHNIHELEYLDAGPFARGYARNVWRARHRGLDVVIKKPIDSNQHLGRFVRGMQWEVYFLEAFRDFPGLLGYHGKCTDETRMFEAVEGKLVRWSWVSTNRQLPWCYRIQFVMDVLDILKFLDVQELVHCDWKFDQVALDLNATVKVVDLKSIRALAPNRLPYKSNLPCQSDETCKKCFRALSLPEHTCLDTGYCLGFNASSLVAVTSHYFFRIALTSEFHNPPHPSVRTAIQRLVERTRLDLPPGSRLSLDEASGRLEAVLREHGGAQCLAETRPAVLGLLRAEYEAMLRNITQRCKSRYC